MRPVSSVWMTVRSSASSCSKFHKATRDPVPPRQKKKKKKKKHLRASPLKWMTSWFPGNEIITGILRTGLILIKSHFLKKGWPQTSHSSHPRSNSSFPIAPSWSPELAKFPPANRRRLSNFSINLMCRALIKTLPHTDNADAQSADL